MITHPSVLHAGRSFVGPTDPELNRLRSLIKPANIEPEIPNCFSPATSESSDITAVGPPRVSPAPVFGIPANVRQFVPPAVMFGVAHTLTGTDRRQHRKCNKVSKGKGPDSVPDPAGRDNYNYQAGHFFRVLQPRIDKKPAEVLKFICRAISRHRPRGLSQMNRWVTRRTRCAYAWLDENRDCISDELLNTCFSELAEAGICER
jgi:hypothetical protein